MDTYSVVTSWIGLGAIVAVGVGYYSMTGQPQVKRAVPREERTDGKKSKTDAESRGRTARRVTSEEGLSNGAGKASKGAETGGKKRKVKQPKVEEPSTTVQTPQVVVDEEKEAESDKQWALKLAQTQKGTTLSTASKKDNRPKTVRQSSAINSPEASAFGDSGDEDSSHAINAGDVNDMLEPQASGPSTLRITPSTKPQKEKAAKKAKEETVESKKARQNRKKVEERRIQREAEEAERKALEEKQRRAAREARGEPARNGIPVSKRPASNAWSPSEASSTSTAKPEVNGNTHQPLFDTFEADSGEDSLAPSTTATSATDGDAIGNGGLSYEDGLAQATRNSVDDGWTTVAQPKKSKKKSDPEVAAPSLSNKPQEQKPAPAVNGKPKGFQALYVPEPATNGSDPNDPASWDA